MVDEDVSIEVNKTQGKSDINLNSETISTNVRDKYEEPIISSKVVKKLVSYSNKEIFCVVPALKVSDSIRTISNDIIKNTVIRNNKVIVQTPQLSNYKVLKNTLKKSKKKFEDESDLFIHNSMKVIAIDGDPSTLKITYEKEIKMDN